MCGGRCGKFRENRGRRGTFVKGHGKCGGSVVSAEGRDGKCGWKALPLGRQLSVKQV